MAKTYIDGRMIVNGVDSHTDVDNRRWLNSLLTYATTAEAIAGTATNLVITPATLSAALGTIGDLESVLVNGNITGANDIQISNGQVIAAVNGGGTLNLREGADGAIALTSDAGGYLQGYLTLSQSSASIGFGTAGYLLSDAANLVLRMSSAFTYLGPTESGLGLAADLGTTTYSLAIADITAGAVTFAAKTNSAISINSGITGTVTTFNIGIDNSVALGGIGITAKTNNTAYVNQLGLNASGSLFEGLLDTATLTADRTYELPDASGKVALIRTTTTAINANAQDGEVVLGTAGGADITITLPNPTGVDNMQITVKKVDAGIGVVNVASPAGTFDGAASPYTQLGTQWESATFVSNGGNWFIISKF